MNKQKLFAGVFVLALLASSVAVSAYQINSENFTIPNDNVEEDYSDKIEKEVMGPTDEIRKEVMGPTPNTEKTDKAERIKTPYLLPGNKKLDKIVDGPTVIRIQIPGPYGPGPNGPVTKEVYTAK